MKKKLIQILMLLVATVSIGSFVSCKDTNEDLYTDLRNAVGDVSGDQTLADRIRDLETKLGQIKECTCNKGDNPDISRLWAILDALTNNQASNTDIDIDDILLNGDVIDLGGGSGSNMNTTINNIIIQQGNQEELIKLILKEVFPNGDKDAPVSNIAQLIADMQAANAALAATNAKVEELEALLNQIKQCNCEGKFEEVWTKLNELELGMNDAKADASAALTKAQEALTNAAAAQAAADAAKTRAEQAQADATQALKDAAKAGEDAAAAQAAAEAAQKTADEAKALAESLQGLADQVNANKENIEKNKEAIDAINTTITGLSNDVATALQNAADAAAQASINKAVIDSLCKITKASEDAIEGLTSTVNTLNQNVTNLTTIVENLTTQVGDNTTNITNLTTNLNNLKTDVTNLTTTVTQVKDALDKQAEKLDNLETRLAAIEAQTILTEEQVRAIAKEEAEAVKTALEKAIEEKLANYYTKDNVYTKEEVDSLLNVLKDSLTIRIDDDSIRIDGVEGAVDNLQKAVDEINTKLEDYKCQCDTAAINKAIKELVEGLANANDSIAAHREVIDGLTDLINEQVDKLAELENKVDNLNYITPEEVETMLDNATKSLTNLIDAEKAARESGDKDLQDQIDAIKTDVTNALAEIAKISAIETALSNLESALDDKVDKTTYEADKTSILDKIDANTTKIDALQDVVDGITDQITALQDDVEDLKTRMATAENNLDTAMKDIMEMKSDIDAIQDYLAKQVTSIEIQGTRNPWYGTFSLPFGIQSNVLIAFYGKPAKDVEFPTSRTANYIREEEALTEKDMEMINGVEIFERFANIPLMYEDNYAGKIYMTINPNTADLTGLQPTIVNSQDEESLITLSPIKKSGATLQFGFTRADNGFYEADASIAPKDVQYVNSPTFEVGAMKDAMENAKDALIELAETRSTGGTKAKLESLASDISTIINGMRFERSGLKCTYTAQEPDGTEKQHSVYSQYNLAATAFRPLNLKTAKDFNYQTVPGYEKVNNLLDRIANKVNGEIHTFFKDFNSNNVKEKLANLEIKKIVVKDLDEDLLAKFDLEISEDFVIEGLSYHLQLDKVVDVPVKFDENLSINLKGLTIPIHIEKDVAVDLTGVTVESPTVVVTGNAIGTASATGEIPNYPIYEQLRDADGNLMYEEDGVTPKMGYVLHTVLLIPVLDNNDVQVGTSVVPLDDINVYAAINASGGADGDITLNGSPVAHVVIDQDVTIDDDRYISYDLHVDKTFQTTINIDEWFYFGDNGTDKKTFHFEKTISMRDAVEELWGNAQEAIGSVNTMLDQLRDLVDAVNDALEQINSYEEKLTNTIDSYIDRLKRYLDKINAKAVALVNSTNSRFQPFMVASTSNGMKRLSGSKSYPTVLSTDVTLHPTSQTLELFVPLARKHVAVTNVFRVKDGVTYSAQDGDSECLKKLKDANTGKLNTVLDGTVRAIETKKLAKYYTYEIAYSALDFEGNIATRKYYVAIR